MLDLSPADQGLLWDTVHALQAPTDLAEALTQAFVPLRKLIPVEHGAIAVGRPEALGGGYDWLGVDLPDGLFTNYGLVTEHDFVRRAALARPGIVVRDDEMLPRDEMVDSLLYRSCRKRGLVMDQIMTVLVPVEGAGHGGLTLYRARKAPFSDREREILQRLAPTLAATLRSHRALGEAAWRGAALEAMLLREDSAELLIALPDHEVFRGAAVDAILGRWFSTAERRKGGLPDPLREALRQAAGRPEVLAGGKVWTWRREQAELKATVNEVASLGRRMLLVTLKEELRDAHAMPPSWKAVLTPKQQEVVLGVLRGWDNALIASELGCSLATVKKHLQRIFDALGVSKRTALMHKARAGG